MFEFFSVKLSADKTEITARCTLASDLPFFVGHFPARPILPAVAQIEMIALLIATETPWNNKIREGRQLKFLQPLLPGDNINFRLQYKEEGEVSFTLCKAKLPASKGKLILTHS